MNLRIRFNTIWILILCTPAVISWLSPTKNRILTRRRASTTALRDARFHLNSTSLFKEQLIKGLFPLETPILLDGTSGVAVFEDQRSQMTSNFDVKYLQELPIAECLAGPMEVKPKPFTCRLLRKKKKKLVVCRDVINSLRAKHFRSDHVPSLMVTELPYLGYKPGTWNDEIHTCDNGQKLFVKEEQLKDMMDFAVKHDDRDYELELILDFQLGVDGIRRLKLLVEEERLWYVLLHGGPEPWVLRSQTMLPKGTMVLLFAVGVSRASGNLVGIVTEQACHNYCD